MHQRKSSFRWISVMLMSVIVLNAVLFGAAGPVKAASPGGLSAYNAAVTAAEMYQAILDYPNDIFETVQQKDIFYSNKKADNDAIVDDLISKRPFASVTDLRDAYGSALDNRNFFLFLHEATDSSGVSAAFSWINDGTFLNPGLDLGKYSALDYTEQAVVDQAVLDGIPVNGYVAAFGIQTIIDSTIGQIVSGALQDDKTALEIGYAVGDSDAHVTQNLYLPGAGTHFTQITWTGGNGVIDPATGTVTPPAGGDVTAALQAKISRNNESVTKDFTLTVKSSAPPATPPAITSHPQSLPPVLEGTPASFSVTATGTGLTYQWQVDIGSGFVNLQGETNAALNIPAVSLGMNNYKYRVVVSGTGGQPVTSNAAVLTVLPIIPIPTLPVIVIHPQSPPSVLEGNPASFSVTATGTGLTYQWQEDSGMGFQDMPGETNAVLDIAAVFQGMDGNRYRVIVTGTGGMQTISNDAILIVTQPVVPPVIKTQPPGDLSVPKGARINLSLKADGRDLSYQWQVNTGTGFHDLPGETGTLLSIFPVTKEMNGNKYRVIVSASGLYPTTSDETLLTVYTTPSAPTNVTATAGNGQAVVSFTAPADGGTAITGYEVTASPGDKVVSGTASPITVTGLTNGTAYTFTVKAHNAAGESAASAPTDSVTPYVPSSGGGGGGGGGGSSEPSTPTPTAPPVTEVPANERADILVNGKTERAGTVKSTEVNGQSVLTVSVDPKKLDEKLASEGQHAVVTIPLAKDKKADVLVGELTGQMVKSMEQKQAVVKISFGDNTYTIPAEQINVGALSDQLGKPAALDDIKVRIEVAAPSKETLKVVENSAADGNFTLVAPAINFAVTGTYGGATVEVSRFSAYVERTIAIPDGVDPGKITTGVVVEADGSVRHVPTRIVKVDGRYFAKINSLTNSTYSVIWHPVEFRDVAGHWAQNAVNDMGSRMVVNGVDTGTFNPDTAITRAEFAAIMVRALGLKQEKASAPFSDVNPTDWYSAAVQTAYAHKLIGGFEDGTFRPSDKITREQAMVIMAKAMKTTGFRDKLPSKEAADLLAPYADAAATAEWAISGVADCLQGAIFAGRTATELAPKASITRAEVAAIVQRLLQKSELI
ncbi:S-layer homology domain-containing protein [Paenibacillus chitinolyticus]|uniref:S-layer homology domain-containing protein n=1 Tax=Paenibacillus chitinolyticus TaxID=79263 RepID=UPI003654110A